MLTLKGSKISLSGSMHICTEYSFWTKESQKYHLAKEPKDCFRWLFAFLLQFKANEANSSAAWLV